MLKIDQVNKKYKQHDVLKNLSLTVQAGQLVHIKGANGSGKSTLFKVITGLLAADSGKVTVGPEDVIGALIENPGFLEFENAMENLRFLGHLTDRFDEQRATQLLTHFDLDPHDHRSVSKYSIGMRQKLGIIQAVMENQNVILLDEPTRGLDDASIVKFIELLQALIKEQKLVIVASHDFVSGLSYDKQWVLKDGSLISE